MALPVPPTFAQSIIPALDSIRGIAGRMGLRPYTVTITVTSWSGSRVGQGTKTSSSLTLTNTMGPPAEPVRVRQVSRKDIIASGGLYTEREFKIGPMTPAYAAYINQFAGGNTDTQLDPAATNVATEVIWTVTGPCLPGNGGAPGGLFSKVGEEATSLHYLLYLRQTGSQGV